MVEVTVAETLVTQFNTEWGSSSVNTGLVLVFGYLSIVTTRVKQNHNIGILLVAALTLLMFFNLCSVNAAA